jgi:hypothetical protein
MQTKEHNLIRPLQSLISVPKLAEMAMNCYVMKVPLTEPQKDIEDRITARQKDVHTKKLN